MVAPTMASRRTGATPTLGLTGISSRVVDWSTNHNRAGPTEASELGRRRLSPERDGRPLPGLRAGGYTGAMVPLAGLTVLDLTQNVAGPFCTQILADLGADVIKVERPGRGDEIRAWAPPWWGGDSAAFLSLNRGKRSLALDVKAGAARPVLGRLVARADG